ncbi:hypothetical protein [Paraburkholderia sp. J12]|uniref:hypothetical protein n=1 Tax=Paraburkholderia sp. J12 TaxID=2805432 RepID=UPI002ABD388A|nr:hypothetical protein [Paraburkholderia sp. J12]
MAAMAEENIDSFYQYFTRKKALVSAIIERHQQEKHLGDRLADWASRSVKSRRESLPVLAGARHTTPAADESVP